MRTPEMILVIDDDPDVRAYLELALQAIGRPVLATERLPAELTDVSIALVDLLLADNTSGVPLIAALGAVGIPTLVMSGLPPDAPEIAAARAAGATGLLSKPFALAELRQAVRGLLGVPIR